MNMVKTNQKQTAAINLRSGIVIDTQAQKLHCQSAQCISLFVYGAIQMDFSVLVVFDSSKLKAPRTSSISTDKR